MAEMSEVKPLDARYSVIMAAHEAALDGRAPDEVEIFDLLPAIFDAVPGTDVEEVIAALRWGAERCAAEAEALKRYGQAKFQKSFDAKVLK